MSAYAPQRKDNFLIKHCYQGTHNMLNAHYISSTLQTLQEKVAQLYFF